MSKNLQHLIDSVRESLPQALIDGAGYEYIFRVAEALPAELTTFCGLECRLEQKKALSDISMETRKDSIGHRILAGNLPSSIDELCNRSVPWRELREFAQLWAGPDHPFHTGIRNIWTEFDASEMASGSEPSKIVDCPCIFFGMEKAGPDIDIGQILNTINPAGGNHEAITIAFNAFRKTLPEKASLFQVGLMLSRSTEALRVCVNGIAPEKVSPWLAGLDWPGNINRCESALEDLAPKVERICVDLNLSPDGIDKKIGLECYMDRSKDGADQWQPLLSFVEQKGLCVPEKRTGLNDFPGTSKSPVHLRRGSEGFIYVNTARKIHHLKLNFDGNTFTEAKAYLALNRPGLHFGKMLAEFNGKKRSPEQMENEEAWLMG